MGSKLTLIIATIACNLGASSSYHPVRISEHQTFREKASELRRFLKKNVDKANPPALHHSLPTRVTFDVELMHIDVDEHESKLMAAAWLTLNWYDDHLHWNPSNYNGLKHLEFENNDLWTPDIGLLNK